MVEAMSNAINVHWPTMKTAATALALLLGSEKFMEAIGLLR